jgi:predicted GIY-YIG superfamily endonuclease
MEQLLYSFPHYQDLIFKEEKSAEVRKKHNKGENIYTKPRRPVTLVTYLAFSDKYKAINFEKYLKSGSGKAFSQKRLI